MTSGVFFPSADARRPRAKHRRVAAGRQRPSTGRCRAVGRCAGHISSKRRRRCRSSSTGEQHDRNRQPASGRGRQGSESGRGHQQRAARAVGGSAARGRPRRSWPASLCTSWVPTASPTRRANARDQGAGDMPSKSRVRAPPRTEVLGSLLKALRLRHCRPALAIVCLRSKADPTGGELSRHYWNPVLPGRVGHPAAENRCDRVVLTVPRRNIETWLAYLAGATVNETDSYPRLNRPSDCKPHVRALADMCTTGELRVPAPPSLVAACDEFRNLFP